MDIHKTPEWKENRDAKIGDHCQWCGATENLHLHHIGTVDLLGKWNEVAWELFEANPPSLPKVDINSLKKHNTCPDCMSGNIYPRKRKKPEYICENCKKEFEHPIERVLQNTIEDEERRINKQAFKDFKEKYKSLIDEKYQIVKKPLTTEYLSMADTITLCKRCHFAIHNSMVLCSHCKSNYHLTQFKCCKKCLEKVNPEKWKEIQEYKIFKEELDEIE